MSNVNVFLAFGAGFLSFISPCCLPLYPAFLSYITGISVGELKSENVLLERRSLLHTLCFLFGFAIPFLLLSFFIGKLHWIKKYNVKMMKFAGVFMIIIGILLFFDLMTEIIIFFSTILGGFTGF